MTVTVFIYITEDDQVVLVATSLCKFIKTFWHEGVADTIGRPFRVVSVATESAEDRNFMGALFVGLVRVPIADAIAISGPIGVGFGVSHLPVEQTECSVHSTIVINGDAV